VAETAAASGVTLNPRMNSASVDVSNPRITLLEVPGPLYAVEPSEGSNLALVCPNDFAEADKVKGNPIETTWSNPELVVSQYKLDQVREVASDILRDIFGDEAGLVVEVEPNMETGAPDLIFRLEIPRAARDHRSSFLDRYVRETKLPAKAPVPVLLWAYRDAVSS
jgi:hypothetical protein